MFRVLDTLLGRGRIFSSRRTRARAFRDDSTPIEEREREREKREMTRDDDDAERATLLLLDNKNTNSFAKPTRLAASKRTPPFKALATTCLFCFALFSVAVTKSKTYRENQAILQTLGVKPISSSSISYKSCEDIVEEETRAMTFYATDLFGWSPFVDAEASYRRRRRLKYSLSKSGASAVESSEPSSNEEAEDAGDAEVVAIASPEEIEEEVGGTDTSDDEKGERQQQQLVVDEGEEEEKEEAATTTANGNDDDDDDAESIEKAAAAKLSNAKELLFVPPDKTPYRYAYIDWLKPALQDDPRMANHINDADMVLFTDSFADANPYMAKFLHENEDEDEESRAQWWLKQKDNAKILAQNLFSRMSKERDIASRAVAFSNFLFPSERFILREKDEIGVPEYAQVGSDAVVGDNKKNSNVFLAVTDVSPTHIWEKAYKTNGIAMLVPFTANSDIARASLKLKNSFFYERERPEMFYSGDLEFLHKTMHSPMKKLINVDGQNIHLGLSKSLNSDNDVRDYAEGSLRSSFCWIPRSYDKARFETSTRVIDSIAAGCIPIVVVDTIAESLPFKWAVDYKSFMLQVPESIFVKNPLEVAEAVSKISPNALQAMRSKMLDARAKLVWNDRNDAGDACDKDTGRCSLAPRLFLDEMLYRVKQNNAEIQSAMCDKSTDGDGSSDWVDGGVWTGEKLCAPWLAKTGLCRASEKDLEREGMEESALSKKESTAEKEDGKREEIDEKKAESEGEEEEEDGSSNNSFDINEELEAAISGKSRAEKMEELEAEQKAALDKEQLKRARKESERKQIEEALKRQEDGTYSSEEEEPIEKEEFKKEVEEQAEAEEEKLDTIAMESSIEDEIEATVHPEVKDEDEKANSDDIREKYEEKKEREEEERDEIEQRAEEEEEKMDTSAMESSIEDEIAATVQTSSDTTSVTAKEDGEGEEEELPEEKEKTPEEEAQDLADDFASASDSGKDSESFGEDLYNKIMGGKSIKSATTTATTDDEEEENNHNDSKTSKEGEEEEDNTGIDLDAFTVSKKDASNDDDAEEISREDVEDGWSSALDNESY